MTPQQIEKAQEMARNWNTIVKKESFDNYATPIIDSLNFKELQDADDAYQRKDYKEAVRLFRLSAEQGVVLAQFNLGLMYAKGQGVPQDYLLAHMWFNISGSNGYNDTEENKNRKVSASKNVSLVFISLVSSLLPSSLTF